uniref:Uncharacterized protein n=1 Tax=viral metagenome TaxID=1070528 RepID=A0A6H1ZHC8_9ZZZZ
MANTIANRLDRIESSFPGQLDQPRRFISLVTNADEYAKALEQARSEGYDPYTEEEEVLIIRLVPGRPCVEAQARET